MKSFLFVLSITLVGNVASAATCKVTVRKVGPNVMDNGTEKVYKFSSTRAYKFFQENYGDFFFQVATRSDGPADGPSGKAKSLELQISSNKVLAESTTSYAPDVKSAQLSLIVPSADKTTGTAASISCTDL